jgi:hypothetical protein
MLVFNHIIDMSTTTHGHFPSMWTNLDGQMAQDNHSFCFRNQAACIHNGNSQRFTYRFATDNQIISVLRKSRISTKLIGFFTKFKQNQANQNNKSIDFSDLLIDFSDLSIYHSVFWHTDRFYPPKWFIARLFNLSIDFVDFQKKIKKIHRKSVIRWNRVEPILLKMAILTTFYR